MPQKKKKIIPHAGRATVIALASIFLTGGLIWLSSTSNSSPFKQVENIIYDWAFSLRAKNPSLHDPLSYEDVVIVDIDNASIAELGRVQQWPRLYEAQVINYLASGEPYGIGVDILYTESDTFLPVYADLLRGKGIQNVGHVMSTLSTDRFLAQAIDSTRLVYLSLYDDGLAPPYIVSDSLPDLRYIITDSEQNFNVINHPVLPIPEFNQAANGTGTITMYSDPEDGLLRQYSPVNELRGQLNGKKLLAPSLPLFMLVDALGVSLDSIAVKKGSLVLNENYIIPLNDKGNFRLNWPGSAEKIRYIPFHKILQGLVPAEYFKDKFVFIGTSASGLNDLKAVPHQGEKLPGVESHAIALLNMANNGYITEYSFFNPWMLLLIMLYTSALAYFFITSRPIVGLTSMLVIILGLLAAAVGILFIKMQIIIPIVAIFFVTVLTNIITTTYNYFAEEKEKIQLKNAFSRYVSPTVVNKIIDDPKSLNLGGTKKILSVLFSDIRGFTSYSEKMDPQNLVSILNNYLSAMSEPILAHEGTIDKFIGDAIFAIFGAPLEYADHADEACEVAIEMINKLEHVNHDLISKNFPPLKIGIGLNTGEMTVGNIGSTKRFDYTAIGDAVNLGSRVEGLTKYFKVDILVSQFTYDYCKKENFLFRALPQIIVMGKDYPVGIYQLLNYAHQRSRYEPWISYWEKGHGAYKNKDFGKALEYFNKCSEIIPGDYSTEVYLGWSKKALEDPASFTNVLTMEFK